MRLSLETRINIARWTEEYVIHLVSNYNGDGDDVRWIIDDLHDQATSGGRDDASEPGSSGATHLPPDPFGWQVGSP